MLLHAEGEKPLQVGGSTTVFSAYIHHREKEFNAKGFEINAYASGQALKDLETGKIDIALISAPLADLVHEISYRENKLIDAGNFKVIDLGKIEVKFVINPDNMVNSLTEYQLANILKGDITRWSEIEGGKDERISVVTGSLTGGLMVSVRRQLLREEDFKKNLRTVSNALLINVVVANVKPSLGIISEARLKDDIIPLEIDGPKVIQSLAVVVKGDITTQQQEFVKLLKEKRDDTNFAG